MLGYLKSIVDSAPIWSLLAFQDIKQRYRRSILGPFWMTLTTFVAIAAIGTVYSTVFKIPPKSYLPFLATGFVCWLLISGLMIDACGTFVSSESIIKQVALPLHVHVCRTVFRNLIGFMHNFVTLIIVIAVFGEPITITDLAVFVFAILCVTVSGMAVSYILGFMTARFRDISPAIASIMQVVFYITPVIWPPEMLASHEYLLHLNPFYFVLDFLRAPLLGHTPHWYSVAGSVVLTIILVAIATGFGQKYNKRLVFWL